MHTHTHTHTCDLVFLEVLVIVVAEELVELPQPDIDLLHTPLLHRKGQAFGGHLRTAADEFLRGGRWDRKMIKCVYRRGRVGSLVQQ